MIDGIIQPSWSSYTSYANAIEDRLAISTPYSLNFNVQGNGTNYQASITVGQISANNVNKVLHLSLTESHIPESWYGGEEVNFVARLMLPDQYGTPLLSKPSFDFDFTLEPGWIADSCELVAFIQDTVTKEIFQAKTFLLSDAEVLSYYDVGIEEIIIPSTEFCVDLIAPKVIIKNQSNEVLESCLITYEINSEQHEYNWAGELQQDSSILVLLPEVTFNLLLENNLIISVSQPNGVEDENPDNNTLILTFYQAQTIEASQLVLEVMTDDFGSETSWELYNSIGDVIYSGEDYENNTLYTVDLEFSSADCYRFVIYDEGGNGICCDNGNGYYLIKDSEGVAYFDGGEFEYMDEQLFQADFTISITQITNDELLIYPNPTSSSICIKSPSVINKVTIYNSYGQFIRTIPFDSNVIQFRNADLTSGVYILKIETETMIFTNQIVIN